MNATLEIPEFPDDDVAFASLNVYVIFGIFGIIVNAIVIITIGVVKDLRGTTNVLIANQSFIDIVASVLLIAFNVVPVRSLADFSPWAANFLCSFWLTNYLFWSSVSASTVNLVNITFERYYAIASPLRYRMQTFKRARRLHLIACAVPWLYGLSVNAYSLAWNYVVDGQTCIKFNWPNTDVKKATGILIFLCNLFGPICLITVLYVLIYVKLYPGTAPYRQRARKNVVDTLALVFLCYVICWLPNDTYSLFYHLDIPLDFGDIAYDATVWMAFANMWINPIIYALRYKSFQKGLKSIFMNIRGKKTDQTSTRHVTTAETSHNNV